MRTVSISSLLPPPFKCSCYLISWLFLWIFILWNSSIATHYLPQLLGFICSKKPLWAWNLVEILLEKIFTWSIKKTLCHLWWVSQQDCREEERWNEVRGSKMKKEAERWKRGEYRWRVQSGRKERAGEKCDLSGAGSFWISGWRQVRSMNTDSSAYIKEPNQVWDYLSWS